MKILLFILLFFQGIPLGPPFAHGYNGFAIRSTITIDHTKVGTVNNTDQSNFPVLVTTTKTYLKTTGNGGSVTNSSGFDIVFTSDPGCTTRLNWEVESWDGTLGTAWYWVQVPTVSHTTDTIIYLCAGNLSITTDQSSTNTWSNSYGAVYHFGSTSLILTDSTGNGNTLSASGTVTSATGQILKAASGTGSSGLNRVAPCCGSMNSITQTVSAWVNTSGSGFVASRDNGSTRVFQFRISSGNIQYIIFIGGSNNSATGSSTVTSGTWRYLTGVYDGSHIIVYVDGASDGSTAQTGSLNTSTIDLDLMDALVGGPGTLNGSIDEVRISTTARSPDWIKTEYNNQSTPSTFLTIVP